MSIAGQNGAPGEKSSTFLMPESQADMMKIQQRRAEKKALKAEKKAEKKAAKKAAKKSRKNSRSASSEEGGSEVDQVDHHHRVQALHPYYSSVGLLLLLFQHPCWDLYER